MVTTPIPKVQRMIKMSASTFQQLWGMHNDNACLSFKSTIIVIVWSFPLSVVAGRVFRRLQKGLCTVQSSVNFMFVITIWRKDHNNADAR